MKNILATLLLISTSAYSQVSTTALAVVETPFWQAPAVQAAQITFKANDPERLLKACHRFKREMVQLKEEGNSRFNREYADRLRKRPHPNDIDNRQFSDHFIIKTDDLSINNQEETTKPKSIPYFNNSESVQNINLMELSNVSIISSEDSMGKISEFFELKIETPVVGSESHGEIQLEVNSLDLACDLIEGKAKLVGEASSEVRLNQERTNDLEKFYQFQVLKQFSDIYKMKVTTSQKALLLGFRLNETFSNEANLNNREDLEAGFISVMSKIINLKDFTPSSYLYLNSGRFFMDSRLYQTNQDVKVTLRGDSI